MEGSKRVSVLYAVEGEIAELIPEGRRRLPQEGRARWLMPCSNGSPGNDKEHRMARPWPGQSITGSPRFQCNK